MCISVDFDFQTTELSKIITTNVQLLFWTHPIRLEEFKIVTSVQGFFYHWLA